MTPLTPTSRVPRIRVLPGGHLVIGMTILLGIAAAHSGQNLLQALVALLLAFQVVSGFRSFLGLRRLEAAVRWPDRLDARRAGTVELRVRNAKRRLSAVSVEVDVVVEDGSGLEVASGWIDVLPAGASVRVSLPVTASERGVARVLEVRLSSAYPCDLFRRVLRFPAPAEVLVRPARLPARLPSKAAARAWEGTARAAVRGSGEFRGVRPYRAGDPHRAIHWKTSARAGALVVREDEARADAALTIVVAPTPEPGEELEGDLSIAASLLGEAAAAGRTVELRLAGAPSVLEVRPGRAAKAALDALARFEPTEARAPGGPTAGLVLVVGSRARPPAGADRVEPGRAFVAPAEAQAPRSEPS